MTSPPPLHTPPLCGRLEEILRDSLGPLAAAHSASVGLELGGRLAWLSLAAGCGCAKEEPDAGPCPGGSGRLLRTWELADGNRLWLCTPPDSALSPELAAALVTTASLLVETEEERDGLCEELGLSFESLASIYEIGEDRSLLLDPQLACSRILERITSSSPGLEAALWLVEGERLAPVQWRCASPPPPLPRAAGVAGRVLEEGRGAIFHAPGLDVLGADLARSTGQPATLALAPLMHSRENIGIIGIWSGQPGAFDSRFMNLVGALANQAAMILVGDRLRRELVANERLQQEVEISARIQQSLLQGSAPQELASLEVGTIAISSRQIDGDFFGFFPHSPRCLDVLIGDVMGKGVPAALVGAAVKSEFLRFSNSLHATGARLEPAPTAAVVDSVHREVAPRLIDLNCFVTAAYARFDTTAGTLEYVDCGHTNTLHWRAARREVVALECEWRGRVNLPLGMAAQATYAPLQIQIAPGDLLLFYSDGVTEAEGPAGDMFGQDRLAGLLRRCADLPCDVLVSLVRKEIKEFTGQYGTKDDLTCLAVRVLSAPAPAARFVELGGATGNLHLVHRFLDEVFAAEPELASNEALAYELRLAVIEAVTNVIRHGYDGLPAGKLRLDAQRSGTDIVLRLRDRGRPFDPRCSEDPDLSHHRESGFGLFLIRNLVDDLTYRSNPAEGNCLVLRKHLSASR